METYKTKKINIEYDKNIKSFKINIEKDTARYFIGYKIKRRIKKPRVNSNNCKKRKLLHNNNNNSIENKKVDKKNDIHADNFDSSKPDFDNIKISSPIQNISTNNEDNHENNSTIKDVVININNRYQKLNKKKKLFLQKLMIKN